MDLLDRARGCLLGGAVGDALGAPVEFMSMREIERAYGRDGITEPPDPASITDDTQMTLFTAEGLIRAQVRWLFRGLCHPPAVVRNAYRRWLWTQDDALPDGVGGDVLDGWLITQEVLHARRAPGTTCLAALREMRPVADSKGCGGVMRVAPVGLLARDPFALASECAQITHGHPTSSIASGAFALMIGQLRYGATPLAAVGAAVERARRMGDEAREVITLLGHAVELGSDAHLPLTDARARIPQLGQGWVAEEALAIAVYAMLAATTFEDAVVIAANHDGDSDSTAAIAGNLMGAHLGAGAIPSGWLARLEAREVIEQVAADLVEVQSFSSDWPGVEGAPPESFTARYPGW